MTTTERLRQMVDASEAASAGEHCRGPWVVGGWLDVIVMTSQTTLDGNHFRIAETTDQRTAAHIAAHSPDVTAQHVAVLRWAAGATNTLRNLRGTHDVPGACAAIDRCIDGLLADLADAVGGDR